MAGTKTMNEAPKPAFNAKPIQISLKKNLNRTIFGTTVCFLSSVHFLNSPITLTDSAILFTLLVYVCATGIWLQKSYKENKEYSFYLPISSIDSLIYAAALAYFFPSYVCAVAVLTIVLFHAVINGGIRQVINDAGAFFIGAAAATLAQQQNWYPGVSIIDTGILFVGMISYFLTYGLDIQRKLKRASTQNSKLQNDVVLHKLRGYKLSRYVSPTVWSALNKGREASLKTERKRVSVFFSDIAGFSSLSEELEAETLTELLNTYLTEMVKIAAAHRGTIDKFMGDGLMVIFGDTNSDGMKADCLRCVAMAIDMRKKMRELETKWFNQGIKKPLKIRMGINSGYCTVGTFGTSEYMDYTVLGTHVNLASRLESAADSGEILVSHETWSLIKDVVMCRDRGEIKAKGFSNLIKVYQVIDFRKDMGRNQSYFEEHSNGFSIHLDLEKIKNYDREKIIDHLEKLAEKIRDKV